MATRYLITGATGATGGEAARLLLERGASVRALAHREDERSRELQQRGAEVVYGNLLNFDAMRSAVGGSRSYLLLLPDQSGDCSGGGPANNIRAPADGHRPNCGSLSG